MEQVVFRAFGVRRAGNHAIIDWIINNARTDDFLHLNNCAPGRKPQDSFIELNRGGRIQYANVRFEQETLDMANSHDEAAFLLISYEDRDTLAALNKSAAYSVGFDDRVRMNIVIYREFLNWFASYYKLIAKNLRTEDPAIRRSEQTLTGVRHWLHVTQVATHPNLGRRAPAVAICYDDWRRDEALRLRLLEDMGLPGRDAALPAVSTFGGGSSFDGLAQGRQAAELATDRRWEAMRDDAYFRRLLELALCDPVLVRTIRSRFPETIELLGAEFGISV